MFEEMRKAIVALVAMGSKRSAQKAAKRLQALLAKALSDPSTAMDKLSGIDRIAAFHALEAGSWVELDEIREGRGGAFDCADLRYWLALAERAGVPTIPAREILALDEDEMSILSGEMEMPDGPIARALQRRAAKVPELQEMAAQGERPQAPDIDMGALVERLYAAMDEVPEGWMVRSNLGGSQELKAWAGAGLVEHQVPDAKFGQDLEVGPGWVRNGNRRRVNPSDERTIMLAVRGTGGLVFVARPWMKPGRFFVGEDPHRHGSVFAGKGIWPCEWRAFVEEGKVVGVSFYYAWGGEPNAENAEAAFAVADMAQRIVDEAKATGAKPRFMDIEMLRAGGGSITEHPQGKEYLEIFGRDKVACTLDFMETEDGLMLLEGGPPASPFGGGHPCGFAGYGGPPRFPNRPRVDGVAFRIMPGVTLGDTKTWRVTDPTGCILSWDEARALTARPAP